MTTITQAFIFAAGRGSRMRPITDTTPKPLVKIHNKSILDYTIEKLNNIDSIQKIIINGFYLGQHIKTHIRSLNNPKIIFSDEKEQLETGGALLFARDEIDFNQPLLTINGDIMWQDKETSSDIALLAGQWSDSQCDILLGLKKKEDYAGYDGNAFGGGDFNVDTKTGALTTVIETPMSHVFVGMQIINPKILLQPLVKELGKCFSMSAFYKAARQKNGNITNIKGIELAGRYFHIGTVDAIKNTEAAMHR